MHYITFPLAGHRLAYATDDDKCASYLEAYRRLCEECRASAQNAVSETLFMLSEEECRNASAHYPACSSRTEVEMGELLFQTSSYLLRHEACLFHGVAFLWRGRAWIFTGPSGAGKSTQYMQWKLRYPEELVIINGDKPVISRGANGKFFASGSPWNGKEHFGQALEAPLGGVIWLDQSKENRLESMSPEQAAPRLFLQFLLRPADEAELARLIALEEALLAQVPVWHLMNLGDRASAELLHDALAEA